MNINIKFLEKELVGATIKKPISGTLSGHAAGEPFDKYVYQLIKKRYNGKTFRQYELLNKLYLDNPKITSLKGRLDLLTSPVLAFLLNRGKTTTQLWTPKNLFVEKQNDTADIIVVQNGFFNLIDVKTYNISLNGQPPNIISSYKLARMAALMLETNDFSSHDITYVDLTWKVDGKNLRCTGSSIRELFKANPSSFYINWAAAMQIQFRVENLDQSYKGTTEQWCRDYLCKFVAQAEVRTDTMLRKFVKPFQKFLK